MYSMAHDIDELIGDARDAPIKGTSAMWNSKNGLTSMIESDDRDRRVVTVDGELRASDGILRVSSSASEFCMTIGGVALRRFPPIRVRVPPIIDFTTHDLASENGWCVKVRHQARWRVITRPRVNIVNKRVKNCFLKLATNPRIMITTARAALAVIEEAVPHMTIVNVPITDYASTRRDEFVGVIRRLIREGSLDEATVVGLFNEARYERIKDFVTSGVTPPRVTSDNIIDLLQEIERRAHDDAVIGALAPDVAAFFEEAAA